MTDPSPWPTPYRATAIIAPLQHVGTEEDCRRWCADMAQREVWVVDRKGRRQVVGRIQHTKVEGAR